MYSNAKKQPGLLLMEKIVNDKLGQSDKSLWTTYQSKCNDHLTPQVKNHTNEVLRCKSRQYEMVKYTRLRKHKCIHQ